MKSEDNGKNSSEQTSSETSDDYEIEYVDYTDESLLADIQRLVAADLSEPYSIYTYRYFLHNWPNLCICVFAKSNKPNSERVMIGTIVSKAEDERGDNVLIGYIAMLAVNSQFRRRGIGQKVINLCCCEFFIYLLIFIEFKTTI